MITQKSKNNPILLEDSLGAFITNSTKEKKDKHFYNQTFFLSLAKPSIQNPRVYLINFVI